MATMGTIDIEYVVREVVRRLKEREHPTAATAAGHEGVLATSEPVVALSMLQDRLQGVRRIVLARAAVITPAARDELNARGIAVEFAAPLPASAAANEEFVVAVCAVRVQAATLAKKLGDALQLETIEENCLPQMIQKLADAIVARRQQALLVTGQPAAALVLANRRQGVRAALAQSAATIDECVAAIGANLLVVDPRGRSEFEICSIARRFAAGRRQCPPDLRAALQENS